MIEPTTFTRPARVYSRPFHTRMRHALPLLMMAAAALGALSVGACTDKSLGPAFQAYYDATSPEYVAYVQNDVKLSDVQKARRVQCVESAKRVLDEVQKGN